MGFIAIIISYPFLGFLIVSTLFYIFCWRRNYFMYNHRLLFVISLVFSRSLTYYAIVDMLMWYFTDHEVTFVRSAVLSNFQGSLSSLFVIFMAHSADSFVGRFRTLLFSTTAFISGVMLLLIFNPYDATWLAVIVLVLLALGKSGDTLLENVLIDLVGDDNSKEQNKKEFDHALAAAFWWYIAYASGAISATMWVAPDGLGGTYTSWNTSFLICIILMTATLMIFCKGHNVYYQGELIHRPIEIFIRVMRASIQKLKSKWCKCSTQERSLERKQPENEGITPTQEEKDQGDNCYDKEDVEVIRGMLRMFPLWGISILVSLISAVGRTFYYEQYDNLENEYDIPVQIYFVIQEFSRFTIPLLYQRTCFCDNQKLQIGVGVFCSILSCVFAWQLEVNSFIPTSFLWLVPQFVMLGCMEGLTRKGVVMFFESQVHEKVKNYGADYMKIMMCLGQLVNIGFMLVLSREFHWFSEGTNDETTLDKYYLILVCVCSVNLIIYCCVAIWFYKDTKQDNNLSHDDLQQHDKAC